MSGLLLSLATAPCGHSSVCSIGNPVLLKVPTLEVSDTRMLPKDLLLAP
jgi:hypothetical protein